MAHDVYLTFANESKIARYEQSFVVSFAHGNLSKNHAILFTICTESACVFGIPVLLFFEIDYGATAILCYIFTVLHVIAVRQNERFLETRNNSD